MLISHNVSKLARSQTIVNCNINNIHVIARTIGGRHCCSSPCYFADRRGPLRPGALRLPGRRGRRDQLRPQRHDQQHRNGEWPARSLFVRFVASLAGTGRLFEFTAQPSRRRLFPRLSNVPTCPPPPSVRTFRSTRVGGWASARASSGSSPPTMST